MPGYRKNKAIGAYGPKGGYKGYGSKDDIGIQYGKGVDSGSKTKPKVYGKKRPKQYPWDRDMDAFYKKLLQMLARQLQRLQEEEALEECLAKLEEKKRKKRLEAAKERARQQAAREKLEEAERIKREKALEAKEEEERRALQKQKELREKKKREEKEKLEREKKALEEKAKREQEEKLRRQKEEEELLKKLEEEMFDIKVVGVNLKLMENAVCHHTDMYEMVTREKNPELVIRRGQEMKMTISFDKEFHKNKYDLQLKFTIGLNGSPFKGTASTITFIAGVKKETYHKQWEAQLVKDGSKDLDVVVTFPCDCIIGEWQMQIGTREHDPSGNTTYDIFEYEQDINVLFNPWCKDDPVYFQDPDGKLLNEYVLNDNTLLFRGSAFWPGEKNWTLDQFDDGILEICFKILRLSFNDSYQSAMGNPVTVCRKLSGIMNSCDNDGVLVGNWSGNYAGGKSPMDWAGSGEILEEFNKNNESVRYGQCWVFSGITLTVLRALGIPSRSVTCFDSAHDTNGNTTIDKYQDEDGSITGNDSIWNFHVWNESYMSRLDLAVDNQFGGWQVIDATPQEKSENKFICGPAPVSALRKGFINVPYDAIFVFAEMNSDVYTYENADTEKVIRKETNVTGTKLYSKAPGKDDVGSFYNNEHDITKEYKFKEGSEENRIAVRRAKEAVDFKGDEEIKLPDIKIKVHDIDKIFIGQDFKIRFNAKNFSKDGQRKLINVKVRLFSNNYTGSSREEVFTKGMGDITLGKGEEVTREIEVSTEDYLSKIFDDANMEVLVTGKCVESSDDDGVMQMSSDRFRLRRPDIDIELNKKEMKVGEEVTVDMQFKTLLTGEQTNSSWTIHCPAFLRMCEIQTSGGEPNKGIWRAKIALKALKKGMKSITATYNSDKLKDISGTVVIKVK